MTEYRYGMRLRGFSIGCQPYEGLLRREDDVTERYYDIIVYDRELDKEEVSHYSLDPLNEDGTIRRKATLQLSLIDKETKEKYADKRNVMQMRYSAEDDMMYVTLDDGDLMEFSVSQFAVQIRSVKT